MKNKTYLVAAREYVENLRTRTFWIGIFFFPVIITLGIMVPGWLERSKQARSYVVVDRSGWLLAAVEKRAAASDLRRLLLPAVGVGAAKGAGVRGYPELIQSIAGSLVEVANAEGPGSDPVATRRELVNRFAAWLTDDGQGQAEQLKHFRSLEQFRGPVLEWWSALGAKEALQIDRGLSRSRYVKIPCPLETEKTLDELNGRIAGGELFAYFVIGPDPVTSNEGNKYVSMNLTDDDLENWFSSLASDEIRQKRLEKERLDPEVASWLRMPVRFESRRVSESGAEESVQTQDKIRQWAPIVFAYILWIAVFSISQMLLTSTIEEKSNRVVEVLLSSVSPLQLMVGKILGIAGTGLTVLTAWVLFFLGAVAALPLLLGADPGFDLTPIAYEPLYIGSFLLYFLLGYLFFAALLVAIGSACNSLKEAQNLMMPVTMLLMVPLFALLPIARDPNGMLARIMSFIPPFTPFVMMNRAAGPPSSAEYMLTTILMLASLAGVFWGAAKIFRVGILMTGKPPKLKEIIRWLRAPVGQVRR